MARGSEAARGAATSAQNISNTTGGNAGALYSTLAPTLTAEALNPAGINPVDMARMDTAAQQSAGGSMAGAVGQGGLMAARTRNAGATDAAVGSAARGAQETLSRGVLGTRIKNAEVKQDQRRGALSGMGSLYGSNLGASVGALGEVANNVNADTQAKRASWDWLNSISNFMGSIPRPQPA